MGPGLGSTKHCRKAELPDYASLAEGAFGPISAWVGGRQIIACDSGWCSGRWQWWGVNEYPDIEALQTEMAMAREYDYFRYVDTLTVLGTRRELP